MRLECCVSSLLSSRSAAMESSIFHAMSLHDVFQGNGVIFAIAYTFQRALSEIDVFEIFQVLQDRLTGVEAFGTPCAAGKLLKTFFDGVRKSDGQHVFLAIQV